MIVLFATDRCNAIARVLLPTLFLLVTVTARAGDSQDPASMGVGWTMTRLDLDVTLDPQKRQIRLSGTACLRLEMDKSFGPTLAVNTRDNVMRWVACDGPAGARIEMGRKVSTFPAAGFADVRFETPRRKGDEIEIRFELHSRGRGMQFVTHPAYGMASWTEAWYPFAIPRLDRGERFTARLVSVPGRTTLRLPSGWISHSDGMLESRDRADAGTIDVYVVGGTATPAPARSYVAGAFTARTLEANGRTISVCLLGKHEFPVDRLAELLGETMRAQEAKLGPFPFAAYGVAEAPDAISNDWYAASQQTFIVARSEAFGYAHGNLPLWSHEMCHAWWGNTVSTAGDGSKMCGEALAQVGALIAIEAIEGREAMVEFLEFSREGYSSLQCARGYFELMRDGIDHPLALLGASGLDGNATHNLADSKGMWVYHMLRERIGEQRFHATLRSLIARFGGRQMSLDDVRNAFVAAAPEAELERFFEQWLDREGAPVIDVTSTRKDAATLVVELHQAGPGEPYALDLELDLVLVDGTKRRERVALRESSASIDVRTTSDIASVVLDPDRRLLIWREAYGPRP